MGPGLTLLCLPEPSHPSLTSGCHLMHLVPRSASVGLKSSVSDSLLNLSSLSLLGTFSQHLPSSKSATLCPIFLMIMKSPSFQAPGSHSQSSSCSSFLPLIFKSCLFDILSLLPDLLHSFPPLAWTIPVATQVVTATLPSCLRPVQSKPDPSLLVLSVLTFLALVVLHSQHHLLCCSRNRNSVPCF